MNLFGKDLARDVTIVAEIGVNHEGDVDTASQLVRLASQAGADAVKFQSYTPGRFISADDPDRFARVTRFGLDESAHRRLAAEATDLGIAFFSTPVTEDWVPLIAELSPAIKIASGDIDFEPVIRASAATGLPVIVSTGNAMVDEIDRAVEWVRQEIGGAPLEERLALMQCVSAYPAPVEEANVLAVDFLKDRYGVPVGYSNHVIGPEACYAAVARGAAIIEVHFTDNKSGRDFRDHELSFEPSDLGDLVQKVARIRATLGKPEKIRQPSEAGSVGAMRKGVTAAADLPDGTLLERAHLIYSRPATQFAANEIESLVGRRLVRAVAAGQSIPKDAVSDA